jgi:predicted metal-dependent peptidase
MARNIKSAEARVARAKTILLIGQPFYGSLICNLHIEENNEISPTMATDGTHIFWNRAFVDKCTDANLVFVLAHETAHCANLHHVRRNGRDPEGWNIAADYAINIDLVDGRVGVAPSCALLERAYKGWSSERIYAKLKKQQQDQPKPKPQPGKGQGQDGQQQGPGQPGQGQGEAKDGNEGQGAGDKPGDGQSAPGQGSGGGKPQAQDPGGCGGILDGGKTPDDLRKQEREWQRNVRQAIGSAMKSGGVGAIPGSMRETLKRLSSGGEDWKHALRNFVDPSSRQDYSWARPDRRFAGMPFILPGTQSNGVNHVVVAVDTSGSINTEKCQAFLRECQALLDQEFMDKLTVIQCDEQIQGIAEYTPGDILPLDVSGRGGTSVLPVWRWVEQASEDISALVYFTDLDVGGFGEEPRCPLLWACQDEDIRRQPPFGDLVVIGS